MVWVSRWVCRKFDVTSWLFPKHTSTCTRTCTHTVAKTVGRKRPRLQRHHQVLVTSVSEAGQVNLTALSACLYLPTSGKPQVQSKIFYREKTNSLKTKRNGTSVLRRKHFKVERAANLSPAQGQCYRNETWSRAFLYWRKARIFKFYVKPPDF